MKKLLFLLLLLALSAGLEATGQTIDLSGTWKFAMDPSDKGIPEKWYNKSLKETVILPGSMSTNGKGEDITLTTAWTGQVLDSSYYKSPEYAKFRVPGNIKIPFWLQSLKHYQGAAWYQKEVTIPESWMGKDIILQLERCHWESRLWIDNGEMGMRNSLGTPHIYDLTGKLLPGKHILTLCVDNRTKEIDPGVNSHSISDHTQTNWNGLVGRLFLEARSPIHIAGVQVFPDLQGKKITAKFKVTNPAGRATGVKIDVNAGGASVPGARTVHFNLGPGDNILTMEYPMGSDLKTWSEFHPAMYNLSAVLTDVATGATDTSRTTFGMREIKAVGRQLMINGQPLYLRGTLECAIFPKTGFPPAETADWLRIFSICRAHGLNHMRFHSWCPPEAAFDAADQAGFYLQVECSSWCNQSTKLGDGNPFDKYLYEESLRMADSYGNHPSFCMMAYGNEPGGKNHIPFLKEFVNFWKNQDNRRIYVSGAGWPNIEENDYLSDPKPRIQGWGEGLKSIINGYSPSTDFDWSAKIAGFHQPVVSHEIGQWCVYPNFREIPKYDGVVRARNFEIFRESLAEHGMSALADSFLLSSGKLQALCYKADIEAALRTPGFSGFQLLDLHDFPGQGSALVGILDAFWDEKGYISPKEFSRFCNSTVPLARIKKFILTGDEDFVAGIEVAHYGDRPLAGCQPTWKITGAKGNTVTSGKLAKTDIPLGNGTTLGKVAWSPGSVGQPAKYTLTVSVGDFSNTWDFWVYPEKNKPAEGMDKILVVSTLDRNAEYFLEKGGSVLLSLKQGTLKPEFGGNVAVGFSSIFWNTAWTHGQPPHTLGILCNPAHPALAAFPSEYHSNWQWQDAMSHASAINLERFPAGIQPVVRIIDDWFTNRPLALILEVKAGNGKILISGTDLVTGIERRPEAQQLLHSLEKYMAGPQFNPRVGVEVELLQTMVR
jgi:hypothetical protein